MIQRKAKLPSRLVKHVNHVNPVKLYIHVCLRVGLSPLYPLTPIAANIFIGKLT